MFSYNEYKEIISIIQSTGRQAGYAEAVTPTAENKKRHFL